MKIRSIVIAAVALTAISPVFASTSATQPEPRQAGGVRSTLLAELGASMRELLRTVTPEISLPALDVRLPTLEPRRR